MPLYSFAFRRALAVHRRRPLCLENACYLGGMHSLDKHERFIELLARGKSLASIATELDVARSTLIAWSRQHRLAIQNARAFELDDLRQRLLGTREFRATACSNLLGRVEEEIKKRDLASLPTWRLFELAESLRRRISEETQPPPFVAPFTSIPDSETQILHEWHADPSTNAAGHAN